MGLLIKAVTVRVLADVLPDCLLTGRQKARLGVTTTAEIDYGNVKIENYSFRTNITNAKVSLFVGNAFTP